MAKADQKTRTCPYCNFQVYVSKAKKVASAADAYKASEILRKLKSDSVQRKRGVTRL